MRDEVTGEWRRLHKEELNDVCCLPDIIRVIQPRRKEMSGVGSTYGKRKEVRTGFLWGNLKERGHMEYLGVDVEGNIKIDLK